MGLNEEYDPQSIPLLLLREGMSHLLPNKDTELALEDELLLCGARGQTLLAQRLSHNIELIDTLVNHNPHTIPLLRWIKRKTTDHARTI